MMGYQDIKALISDATELARGAKNYKLTEKLHDITMAAYNLLDENRELRLENEDLKNVKMSASELVVGGNAYYKKDGQTPYCTTCWDSDNKLIRLILYKRGYAEKYLYGQCNNCGAKSIPLDIENVDYEKELKALDGL